MNIKEKIKKIIDHFWKYSDDFAYETLFNRDGKPFENEHPEFIDDKINNSFIFDNKKWLHSEYIKHLTKKIIIEPDYTYSITDFNRIILSGAFYPALKPSVPRYLFSKFKKKKKYNSVIIFDGQVGTNYFHFFSDVLHKIWLFEKIPDAEKLPVIIGEKTFNTLFFQHILNNTFIKKFNWVVQKKHDYITADSVYFIRPYPYDKEYFKKTKRLVLEEDENNSQRNVFLNRSIKTGRFIENFTEIIPILEKYDFEIIDTAGADFKYQIELFSGVRNLISIHGAGNTNIMFSKPGLRFLELLPGNRLSSHYYWLATVLNISYYNVICGNDLPFTNKYPEKGFFLDPFKFENAVRSLLGK